MMNAVERFNSKIKYGPECWEWQAAKTPSGYGQFKYKGTMKIAHRVAFEFFMGVKPGPMCVLHRCDNPSCERPDHLFLGTQQDNIADMLKKGRHPGHSKTHCKHGHEFTEENTYKHTRKGTRRVSRYCRECRKLSCRRRRAIGE